MDIGLSTVDNTHIIRFAENIIEYKRTAPSEQLNKVHTPNKQTIEEVAEFLGVEAKDTCKAVVYQQNHDDLHIH